MESLQTIEIGIGIILAIVFLWWLFFRPKRDKQRCFNKFQKEEILKRQNYNCATCGDEDYKLFEFHHKVNWADNGRTDIENGVALCSKCHSKIIKDYSER